MKKIADLMNKYSRKTTKHLNLKALISTSTTDIQSLKKHENHIKI